MEHEIHKECLRIEYDFTIGIDTEGYLIRKYRGTAYWPQGAKYSDLSSQIAEEVMPRIMEGYERVKKKVRINNKSSYLDFTVVDRSHEICSASNQGNSDDALDLPPP